MKRALATISALVFSLFLAGCQKDSASDPTETISYSPESSLSDLSVSAPAADEPLQRAELDRILDVFEKYSYLDLELHPDFDYAGYCCDYIPDCVDSSQSFEEEIELRDWPYKTKQNYYKVASGEYSTESGFNTKLDEIFTEDCKARYLELSRDEYRFKNNETYVAELNYLSYDAASACVEISAERADENTVDLTLSGSYSPDTVKLVKGGDGKYRIAEAESLMSLSRRFKFDVDLEIVCGDITINRPSRWDTTVSSEMTEFWSSTRFEQCVEMLKDHAYINYEIRLRPDTSQSVTEERSEQPFYKVSGSPLSSEKLFLQQVGLIYTDKFREQYLSNPDRKFTFKNGELYVAENEPQKLAANGGGISLDSMETPDESTIIMNFTVVSEPPSGTSEFRVKFVKEKGDFYKIDEITSDSEIDLAECFWFYSELTYKDIAISIYEER